MIRNKVKDSSNDKDIVNTYDELPLWAASFGLKLLDKIEYRKNTKVLDVGCGVGFPSLEIAQRIGSSSKVCGLDVWEVALEQARYKAVLKEMKLEIYLDRVEEHIHKHRKPINLLIEYATKAGFHIDDVDESLFTMRFSNGEALFGHHFIRLCFLKPWIDIVGDEYSEKVFEILKQKLDDIAEKQNGLSLSIPFVCINCRKR